MFKSDGPGPRMGRGLLGDAPGRMMAQAAYPPPPPMANPLMGASPANPHGGKGLLGDAPSDQFRFQAGHPSLAEQNNLSLPQSSQPIYQQPTISLTQQLRKLREMNARVILLNMPRHASDDQIIAIGQKFGEIKNYLNTSKGKAWLEFEEHPTAYRAMEAIGNGEVTHMNFPITVQLSNWKEIVRKDGRDYWKSGKRKLEEPSEPGSEEPEIKVRRESNASSHRSLNSQTSAPESLEISLFSALNVAKELERSSEDISAQSPILEKCLTHAKQIINILSNRLDTTGSEVTSGVGTEISPLKL